jgi:hypothetical protein
MAFPLRKFSGFAALRQNVSGAKIVVTINGFTDSAVAAGAFAAFALRQYRCRACLG